MTDEAPCSTKKTKAPGARKKTEAGKNKKLKAPPVVEAPLSLKTVMNDDEADA